MKYFFTIFVFAASVSASVMGHAQFELVGNPIEVTEDCEKIASVDMSADGQFQFQLVVGSSISGCSNNSGSAYILVSELQNGQYQQTGSPIFLNDYHLNAAEFIYNNPPVIRANSAGDCLVVASNRTSTFKNVYPKMQIFERNESGFWILVYTAEGQAFAGSQFGRHVSINSTGDSVLVSAPTDNFAGPNSGRVFSFYRESGIWQQSTQSVVGVLPNDQIGASGVQHCEDGDGFYVSTENELSGKILRYSKNGGVWILDSSRSVPHFGNTDSFSVTPDGTRCAIYSYDSGLLCEYGVDIYSFDVNGWEFEDRVENCNNNTSYYGSRVKINSTGDRVFFSMQSNSSSCCYPGYVEIWGRYLGQWFIEDAVNESGQNCCNGNNWFGADFAINNIGSMFVATLPSYQISKSYSFLDSNDSDNDGIPQQCDIDFVAGEDCDGDGQADFCQLDSDGDGQIDPCDPDDDNDGLEDLCDPDTEGNSDCNQNGIADSCDLTNSSSSDCNGNAIPDECDYNADQDCNSNGILDSCDIILGVSLDCSGNGVPDECEISSGSVPDCNGNGLPDSCDYANDADCNVNGVIDACDILLGIEEDCDGDGLPDSCYYDPSLDCDSNGVVDFCDIASGAAVDCDSNGVIDFCETVNDLEPPVFDFVPADITLFADSTSTSGACGAIAEWPEATVTDNCGLQSLEVNFLQGDIFLLGTSTVEYVAMDESGNSSTASFTITVLNLVDPDCDDDGIPDLCEESFGDDVDSDGNGIPDNCEPEEFRRGDSNQDGQLDVSDCVSVLELLFGSQTFSCQDSADMNDDGALNIADTVYGLSFLFNGGPEPADPGPVNCAPDPTEDSLDCESYLGC